MVLTPTPSAALSLVFLGRVGVFKIVRFGKFNFRTAFSKSPFILAYSNIDVEDANPDKTRI